MLVIEMGSDDEADEILVCLQCHRWVKADEESKQTSCKHSWDTATADTEYTGKEIAQIIYDACVRHIKKNDETHPKIRLRWMDVSFDLGMNGDLPDDDNREYLANHLRESETTGED